MLRDRFSRWGINNKNRRPEAIKKRVRQSGVHKSRAPPFVHRSNEYRLPDGSFVSFMCPAAIDLRVPFSTPEDERHLRQTLKGIMDWRDYFQALGEGRSIVARSGRRFMTQIARMANLSLTLDLGDFAARKSATQQLTQMGNTLSQDFHSKCTPLAVLMSINTIFSLRTDAKHWLGHAATLNFLLHLAIESLCESNPALRLLREVLHGRCTPEFLANVYQMGCGIIEQSPGARSIFRPRDVDRFRRKFVQGAIQLGMDAAFTFHFHDLWLATCERKSAPGGLLRSGSSTLRDGTCRRVRSAFAKVPDDAARGGQ